MTHSEANFKRIVKFLIENDLYPSPTRINQWMGTEKGRMNNLSGRECKWRREVPGFLEMQAERRKRGRTRNSSPYATGRADTSR